MDELWIGVKGQSNQDIAGSPRNHFRTSLEKLSCGGRALFGLGALPGYRTQINSKCHNLYLGSETVGDKLHCREGNSPDRRLRPLSVCLVAKEVVVARQPGGWLRSSHSFKECVIAHWSIIAAPRIQRGSSTPPKPRTSSLLGVVGERSVRDEARPTRTCGQAGIDHAGMSNEKAGESPARRKPKVSGARFILLGSAGP